MIGWLVVFGTSVVHTQPATAQVPEAGVRAPTLAALASRVEASETIYVRLANGEDIQGRFVRVSATALTVLMKDKEREITAGDIRSVARRGANRSRQGMKYGFLGGALIADIGMLTSSSSEDVGLWLVMGTLAGGAAGLLWGGLIGALMHERPVVYQAPEPTVRFIPVLGPGRAAVMLSARF